MPKKYFSIFIIISLVFVIIFLTKNNYSTININKINFTYLYLSLFFLFNGFIFNAVSWYLVLKSEKIKVSLKTAMTSHGFCIFGKYIPGKIWSVIGRASYLSDENTSLQTTVQLSFYAQILSIWTGIGIGLPALLFNQIFFKYCIFIIILWILILLSLFLPLNKINFLNILFSKLNKTKIDFIKMDFKFFLKNIPSFIFFWSCWTIAFYFLLKALFPMQDFGLSTSAIFPLSASLGIIAFIFPGGIGIREGLLVGGLTATGMGINDAILVSLVARIWFFVGEFFIFFMALICKYL